MKRDYGARASLPALSAQRESGEAVIAGTSDYKATGWHSRWYLPHFDAGEVFQSITFRLSDSMPQELLMKWKQSWRASQSKSKTNCGGRLSLSRSRLWCFSSR